MATASRTGLVDTYLPTTPALPRMSHSPPEPLKLSPPEWLPCRLAGQILFRFAPHEPSRPDEPSHLPGRHDRDWQSNSMDSFAKLQGQLVNHQLVEIRNQQILGDVPVRRITGYLTSPLNAYVRVRQQRKQSLVRRNKIHLHVFLAGIQIQAAGAVRDASEPDDSLNFRPAIILFRIQQLPGTTRCASGNFAGPKSVTRHGWSSNEKQLPSSEAT